MAGGASEERELSSCQVPIRKVSATATAPAKGAAAASVAISTGTAAVYCQGLLLRGAFVAADDLPSQSKATSNATMIVSITPETSVQYPSNMQ